MIITAYSARKEKITRLSFLLLTMFLFALFCPAATAADAEETGVDYYVLDLADLVTTEEDNALEEMATTVSEEYSCGIYILTIDDELQGSDDIFDFAEWFYITYNLGEGEYNSGVLLTVNAESREFATYFYGETADYAFDSYGQEELEDYFLPELHDDEWYAGLKGFINGCEIFLKKAADGNPVRRSHTLAIVICVAVSLLIALIVCSILKSKMKSVHTGTKAANYVIGGIQLMEQHDNFTHTTTTRTRIERDSDSGTSSSSRSGSSGGSGRSGSF